MTEELTHENCSELLRELVSGRLSDGERDAVEQHLRGCGECAAERDALVALAALAPEPGPGLDDLERARLHRAVDRERAPVATPVAGRRPGRLVGALSAAAVIALLAVGAVFVGSQVGDTEGGGAGVESAGQPASAPRQGAGAGREEQPSPEVADENDTAQSFSARPRPQPSFAKDRGDVDPGQLRRLGKDGEPFTSFKDNYTARSSPQRSNAFLTELADKASDPATGRAIMTCGRTAGPRVGDDALPAYAATGRVSGQDVVILGYAEASDGGPLDRFLVLAYQIGSCAEVEEVSGTIGE